MLNKDLFKKRSIPLAILYCNTAFANPMTIKQIIEKNPTTPVAILEQDQKFDGKVGDTLEAFRNINSQSSLKIKTGELKILSIERNHILAAVTLKTTQDAQSSLEKFAYIMAGDSADLKVIHVNPNLIVSEDVTLNYKDLFADPFAKPTTFELSDNAIDILREKLSPIQNKHVQKLIIESHTDSKGNSSDNQAESLQRAFVVKQALIKNLGFVSDRIIAIGMGESENKTENYLPDSEFEDRKIVLKIVNE